jgi:hypothetical protein
MDHSIGWLRSLERDPSAVSDPSLLPARDGWVSAISGRRDRFRAALDRLHRAAEDVLLPPPWMLFRGFRGPIGSTLMLIARTLHLWAFLRSSVDRWWRRKEFRSFYALRDAADQDRPAAARMIEADPSVLKARNGLGETALQFLVVEDRLEAVRFLAERGADVNTRNRFGATPLSDALKGGLPEMVDLLRSLGAK